MKTKNWNIKSNIVKYVNEGVLENKWAGFVYLDRQLHALSRKWLIVALDLASMIIVNEVKHWLELWMNYRDRNTQG